MSKKPKKRINLTVDYDVWTRCQKVSSLYDFVNWSEVAQTAFEAILLMVEEAIDARAARESPEDSMQKALLKFQAEYYSSLSHAYESLYDSRSKSSVIKS